MKEIWKNVVGHEGAYQVSNKGRVRSLNRWVVATRDSGTHKRFYRGKLLKPGAQLKSGHVTVALGKGNSRPVHQLVLEAFRGPCPAGMESLHKNLKSNDNRLSNLKWGTRSENLKMDYAAGLRKTHPNFNRWGYVYG